MNNEKTIQHLKDELDHFIRLSHAQSEQLQKYAALQKRSHELIIQLKQKLESFQHPSPQSQSAQSPLKY
jgi:hypothetical protein